VDFEEKNDNEPKGASIGRKARPDAGRVDAPADMLEKAGVQESDMAEGLNKVMLLGNLGADPELRVTPGGQSILKLRLATTESYLDKGGTRQERTDWHSITVWGKRGEALSKILAKGSSIFVEGRIQTSSYEKNGEKRYRTDIVANNIILTGRGRAGGAEQGYEGAARSERSHGGGGAAPSSGRGPGPAAAEEVPTEPFSGGAAYDADDEIPF
jgi:single-strand DNA-binding protein